VVDAVPIAAALLVALSVVLSILLILLNRSSIDETVINMFSAVQTNDWKSLSSMLPFPGRSIVAKKGEGSQVKESTDSSNATLEDDDTKGN
jgi:hypothetical protein